jgi:dihydroorotate dehydrogenase
LPPESAHHAGVAGLKFLGLPGVRSLAGTFSRVEDPALRVTLGAGERALSFSNPVGLAAGFDKNAEAVPGLAALGFGFLEVGTLTPRPQEGNPKPRVFRVPQAQALINRLGFNNVGIPGVGPVPRVGIPVGFNIGKNKDTPNEYAADDYLACLDAFFDRADFFVANVSSPNTPGLRGLQAPAEMEPLLNALARRADGLSIERSRPRPPLFVKISPDEDFGEGVAEAALKAGFDGIVATNTTRSREGLPADVPQDGGMSGKPLFARSTEWVRRIYRSTRGSLPIIGVGGIFSARDAYEKILAGASLVEVYTGFIYNGPGFVGAINRGLLDLLRRDGFSSIREAVGKKAQ